MEHVSANDAVGPLTLGLALHLAPSELRLLMSTLPERGWVRAA